MLLQSKNKKNQLAYSQGRFVVSITMGLPFCLYIYNIKKPSLYINYFWHLLEITIYKINIIIGWGKDGY